MGLLLDRACARRLQGGRSRTAGESFVHREAGKGLSDGFGGLAI